MGDPFGPVVTGISLVVGLTVLFFILEIIKVML